MIARLISYSKPAEDLQALGITDAKELVAFCARVSNPDNQINNETSDKLIRYLIKHKHWSPLEMASACIEIKTTRDIGRQILRHRSFSFQEFSQRYAKINIDNFVLREARLQDIKNRQNSIDTDDDALQAEWNRRQQLVIDAASETYEWALDQGIAKEQARVVLPEGNTPSTMYVNGTIRSWVHFMDVRLDVSTQKEHRAVALACAEAIAQIWAL